MDETRADFLDVVASLTEQEAAHLHATMRARLASLLDEGGGLRSFARWHSYEPTLCDWIMHQTRSQPFDISWAERVYLARHGVEQANCSYGQRKKFNTLAKGYRFCGSACQCRREEQSRKIKAREAAVTPEQRAERMDKQKATLMERHGVTNGALVAGAQDRARETSMVRYGVPHPMKNRDVQEQLRSVMQKKYGVDSPGACSAIQEKARATVLLRYGKPHTMDMARAAFRTQTGVDNPFLLPEMQDRARATMLARHGVEKALQSPVIRRQMEERLQAQYGVANVMQRPDVQMRLAETVTERYGRRSPNQKHFSDETFAVLEDGDAFRALFKTLSLREVAVGLGIGYDTARKYCVRYGIDLPRSSYEDAISAFLQNLGFCVERNDRTLIGPHELDIMLPEQKLAIEFCGIYWHGERHKPNARYHLAKLEATNARGHRLVTVFEDEWIKNRAIVESRLQHILGCAPRGKGARKLQITPIDSKQATQFLDAFHIQGGGPKGYARYGAFDDGALVAVMTFSRGRIAVGGAGGPPELLRFATDGRSFPGIASRLFKAYQNEHQPSSVITFADRRWSEGDLYPKLGFTRTGETEPNYWYVHPNRVAREHRFKYRKDRIKDRVSDGERKTEREIMLELGFDRIWDCGNLRFLWTR